MTDERRVLWHLKKVPLFKPLSVDEVAALAHDAEAEEFRRRRVIYMPGDPGDSVLIVNTGKVRLSRVTPDGKALTLAYRGPGALFGELCILDGGPREEMAEAAETAVVTRIPRQRFDRVLTEHPEVSYLMVKMLADTRRTLEGKIEDLVFKDVTAKLAELLLGLSASTAAEGARGAAPAIKMTHQEMANLIGSTRETVSLTLSQFKRRKLIQTNARRITVVNHEALQALV